MGYSHYYRFPATLDAARFAAFVADAEKVCAALDIPLGDAQGEGLPIFDADGGRVIFNGATDSKARAPHYATMADGLTWPTDEARGIATISDPDPTAGGWMAGPTLNARALPDNGDGSYETFLIQRDNPTQTPDAAGRVFECVKTNFRPYDLAVQCVLVALAEHFGGAVRVTSDGGPMQWREAGDICQHVLGYGLGFRPVGSPPEPIRQNDAPTSGNIEVGQRVMVKPRGYSRAVPHSVFAIVGNLYQLIDDRGELADSHYRRQEFEQVLPDVVDLRDVVDHYAEARKIETAKRAGLARDAAEQKRKADIERGRAWIAANPPPAGMVSVILAELRQDKSDIQSDYHGCSIERKHLLAWSMHSRNNFQEMRKAAARFEETKHLGPGCDAWRVCGMRPRGGYDSAETFSTSVERWEIFPTEAEALARAAEYGRSVETWPAGFSAPFTASRESIEHRENYSMGGGLYLGHDRYSGWIVQKHYAKLDPAALPDSILEMIGAGRHSLDAPAKPGKPKAKPAEPVPVAPGPSASSAEPKPVEAPSPAECEPEPLKTYKGQTAESLAVRALNTFRRRGHCREVDECFEGGLPGVFEECIRRLQVAAQCLPDSATAQRKMACSLFGADRVASVWPAEPKPVEVPSPAECEPVTSADVEPVGQVAEPLAVTDWRRRVAAMSTEKLSGEVFRMIAPGALIGPHFTERAEVAAAELAGRLRA